MFLSSHSPPCNDLMRILLSQPLCLLEESICWQSGLFPSSLSSCLILHLHQEPVSLPQSTCTKSEEKDATMSSSRNGSSEARKLCGNSAGNKCALPPSTQSLSFPYLCSRLKASGLFSTGSPSHLNGRRESSHIGVLRPCHPSRKPGPWEFLDIKLSEDKSLTLRYTANTDPGIKSTAHLWLHSAI